MFGIKWRLSAAAQQFACSRYMGGVQRLQTLRRLGMVGIGNCWIEPGVEFRFRDIQIGDGSYINTGSFFEGDPPVVIGRNVAVGPYCRVLTRSHELDRGERRAGPLTYGSVTIGDGTWTGASVTILPGVDVAPGCVIAAGTVVAKSTAPDGLYAGVPAHRIRDLQSHRGEHG